MECSYAFIAYDTLCRIIADVPLGKEDILRQCGTEAMQLEKTLSMFDPDSELSLLCKNAEPNAAIQVSQTLFRFLEENLAVCSLTDGAFDPTVGRLVKLWDFLSETPEIPHREEIKAALEQVGYRHITLDPSQCMVCFDISNVSLDPGAAGKGFALGLATERLKAEGVKRAVLDYGGNLFVMGGKLQDGEELPWCTAIRDPDDPGTVFGTVELFDAGIATSSWYEHSFQKDGKIYHHLLDPRTGYPIPLTLKSVSIISSRPVYTDLLSTAFFVLGEEKGCELVKRLREETGERIDYIAVRNDATIAASPGACFKQRA